MRILPIVERELRVASRRLRMYLVRSGAVLLLLAFSIYLYGVLTQWRGGAGFGMQMLAAVSYPILLVCFFSGVQQTSDCLSREKREGTLGLLFLTNLRSYDIVFGKLVGYGIVSFGALLAVFPVLAVAQTWGGVQPGQFWRLMLVFLNTAFVALAVGLVISTFCKEEKHVRSLTGFVLFFFMMGRSLLPVWLPVLDKTSFKWLSDMIRQADALNLSATTGPALGYFWTALFFLHGFGWLLLGIACWRLPYSWQDRPPARRRWVRLAPWRWRWFGNESARLRFRRWMLNRNPIAWLTVRERWKIYYLWFLIAVAGGVTWAVTGIGNLLEVTGRLFFSTFAMSVVAKLWVAQEAGYRFWRDGECGALEQILATPLTVSEIVRGQLRGLWQIARFPIGFILVMHLAIHVVFRMESAYLFGQLPQFNYSLLCKAMSLVFCLDLIAGSMVGMWAGVYAKSLKQVSNNVVFRVLVLPWIIMIAFQILGVVKLNNIENVTRSWFLLSVLLDGLWIVWAHHQLANRFRTEAAARFQAPESAATKMWKMFGSGG